MLFFPTILCVLSIKSVSYIFLYPSAATKKMPIVDRRYNTTLATKDNWMLRGFCVLGNDRLVTVEVKRKARANICLYEIEPDQLRLLDDSTQLGGAKRPRVDENGTIYIPAGDGVAVLEKAPDDRLVFKRPLEGDGKLSSAMSLALVDDTRLCVTVYNPYVYLVDTQTGRVTGELERPAAVVDLIGEWQPSSTYDVDPRSIYAPCAVSTSREILVGWLLDTRGYMVVIYPHGQLGSSTLISAVGPGTVDGLCVTQRRDGVRYFVSDSKSNCVLILDEDGEIRHRLDAKWADDIAVDPDTYQLWMSCWSSGQILVFNC